MIDTKTIDTFHGSIRRNSVSLMIVWIMMMFQIYINLNHQSKFEALSENDRFLNKTDSSILNIQKQMLELNGKKYVRLKMIVELRDSIIINEIQNIVDKNDLEY